MTDIFDEIADEVQGSSAPPAATPAPQGKDVFDDIATEMMDKRYTLQKEITKELPWTSKLRVGAVAGLQGLANTSAQGIRAVSELADTPSGQLITKMFPPLEPLSNMRFLKKPAQAVADYTSKAYQATKEEFPTEQIWEPGKSFSGQQAWKALSDPTYWLINMPETVIQQAPSLIAGAGMIKHGAKLASSVGGAVGGVQEGASEYESLRGQGMGVQEAALRSGIFGAITAKMDALPLEKMFGEVGPGVLSRIRKMFGTAFTEALTEGAEEPISALVDTLGREGYGSAEVLTALKDSMTGAVNAMVPAFASGLGMGMFGGSHEPNRIQPPPIPAASPEVVATEPQGPSPEAANAFAESIADLKLDDDKRSLLVKKFMENPQDAMAMVEQFRAPLAQADVVPSAPAAPSPEASDEQYNRDMEARQMLYPAPPEKPVWPEAEATSLRADQRYRMYRQAGYSDSDAMGFVENDQADDAKDVVPSAPAAPSPEASDEQYNRDMESRQMRYPAPPEKPVWPEAEATSLRADQRYRMYRQAGYSDSDAMGFVENDQADDAKVEAQPPAAHPPVPQGEVAVPVPEPTPAPTPTTPQEPVPAAAPTPEPATPPAPAVKTETLIKKLPDSGYRIRNDVRDQFRPRWESAKTPEEKATIEKEAQAAVAVGEKQEALQRDEVSQQNTAAFLKDPNTVIDELQAEGGRTFDLGEMLTARGIATVKSVRSGKGVITGKGTDYVGTLSPFKVTVKIGDRVQTYDGQSYNDNRSKERMESSFAADLARKINSEKSSPAPAVPPKLAAIAAKEKARKDTKPDPLASVPPTAGTRKASKPGIIRLEAARQTMRDIINNTDIVGSQRADAIANARNLVNYMETHANEKELADTGVERGDDVVYTREDAPDGMRTFMYLNGSKAGQTGVAATPEAVAVRAAKSQEEYLKQQEDFAKLKEKAPAPEPAASEKQAKAPEMMTPEEAGVTPSEPAAYPPRSEKQRFGPKGYANATPEQISQHKAELRAYRQAGQRAKDRTEKSNAHWRAVESAAKSGNPINAKSFVWRYPSEKPTGYVRDGDRYVFKPAAQEAATTPTKVEPVTTPPPPAPAPSKSDALKKSTIAKAKGKSPDATPAPTPAASLKSSLTAKAAKTTAVKVEPDSKGDVTSDLFPDAKGKKPTLERVRERIAQVEKDVDNPDLSSDELDKAESKLARLRDLAGKMETKKIEEMRQGAATDTSDKTAGGEKIQDTAPRSESLPPPAATASARYSKSTSQQEEVQRERIQWKETNPEREEAFRTIRTAGKHFFIAKAGRDFDRANEAARRGGYRSNPEIGQYLSDSRIDDAAYDDPANIEYAALCASQGFTSINITNPNDQVHGFILQGGTGPNAVVLSQHNVDEARRHEFFHVLDSNGDPLAARMKADVDGDGALYRRYKDNLDDVVSSSNPDDLIRSEIAADRFAAIYSIMDADVAPTAAASDVTSAQDADYLAAVERGDMETAQRMVDEAAKERIDAAIEEAREKYDYVGVRSTDDPAQTDSRKWDDGYPTEETLGGLSVSDASTNWAKHHIGQDQSGSGYYLGKFVQVVASNERMDGEDVGESVLVSPVIIRTIDTPRTGVTRDEAGRVIPLSERFNERSPDIRYQRVANPTPTPAPTPADPKSARTIALNEALIARNEALIAKLRAELAALPKETQDRINKRVEEFMKGRSKTRTPEAGVDKAFEAGIDEESGIAKIVDKVAMARKTITSGKLAQLVDTLDALRDVAEDFESQGQDAGPEELRRLIQTALFSEDSRAADTIFKTYDPQDLLDRMTKQVEKQIRASMVPDIKEAYQKYGSGGKAYQDLTDESKELMDRFLSMVGRAGPLDSVPTRSESGWEWAQDGSNNIIDDTTGAVVGTFDVPFDTEFFTAKSHIDIERLHAAMKGVLSGNKEDVKARAAEMKKQTEETGDAARRQIHKATNLADPAETLGQRLETQKPDQPKKAWFKGDGKKWRSYFQNKLGKNGIVWQLVDALRKGDSLAKGVLATAREKLTAVFKRENLTREDEHRWNTKLDKFLLRVAFGKIRVITIGMTKAQQITFLNEMQDPQTRRKLMRNGFNLDTLMSSSDTVRDKNRSVNRAIMESLERQIIKANPQVVRVANAMQQIVVEAGADANKVSQYFYGRDEFTNKRYWPSRANRTESASQDEDKIIEASKGMAQASLKNIRLAKRRVSHNRPMVIGNAFNILDEHVSDIGRYTHMTIPATEFINAMTVQRPYGNESNPASAIDDFTRAFGKEYRGLILRGFQRIVNGDVTHLDNKLLRTFKRTVGRIAGSILAGGWRPLFMNRVGGYTNAATWIRQYAPGAQEQRDQIAKDFRRIGATTQIGQEEIVNKLMENGYLKDRWLGRAIRLALGEGDYSPSNFRILREMERATEFLNKGMMRAERANSIAMYRAMTKNGVSHEVALDAVEMMNRDTQNSTSELDKSERAANIQQALFMFFPFISQGLVQWDFVLDTFAQAKREGWKLNDPRRRGASMAFVWNSMMMGAVLQMLTRIMKGEEDDDAWRKYFDIVTAPFEQLNPMLKMLDFATLAFYGFITGKHYTPRPNNLLESTINDLSKATMNIVQGDGDYVDYLKELSAILKFAGGPSGIIGTFRDFFTWLMPETKGQQMRHESGWFDDQAEILGEQFSAVPASVFRAQTDSLFSEAVQKGYITPEYSKAAFADRIASRYKKKGGVIIATPKEPKD